MTMPMPPQMPPPPAAGRTGYPVRVTFDRNQEINRLWGIPFFGMLVRWLLLIPHFLVIMVLGIASGLSLLVTWIPILFTGRFPVWALDLYELTYRWFVRVSAYFFLMTDAYPPFSGDAPYPADVTIDAPREINQLWGIPLLGAWVRGLLTIPQAIVLFFLGIGIGFALLVIWLPVLVNGRFPQLGYDLFGGYLRMSTRVSIYTLLVPVPYPPFGIEE
ncbi:MAG: DUF4389 domain-containing protein [Chloroflexi bacterium]|nr:DUF4389 domain-containing protein [Chloroflexota bacterium]